MFELNQLRCFVAVAEELNFRRAAGVLGMTQPPLSRQIQLLEHATGVTLLHRTTRAVSLTPAGQIFLRSARYLLQVAENAGRDARRAASGERGEVTIAFTAASSYAYVPRLVALIRQRMPDLVLTLREMVTSAQLDALQAGEIDFGLLRPPVARTGIRAIRVHREPLVLALPAEHRLASKEAIEIAELAGEPLISFPSVEGRYFHDLVAAIYAFAGIAPSRVQYITQTHSIMALVGAGIGVAIVPSAARRLQQFGVVVRDLPTTVPVTADLAIASRTDMQNPSCLALAAMLDSQWPALSRAALEDAAMMP